MKAQWQIIDVETKKVIPVGRKIELVDFCKHDFDEGRPMSWLEATMLFGDPSSTVIPRGIIRGLSPIKSAMKSIKTRK